MTAVPDDAHYFNIHKRLPALQLDDFWDDNPNPRIADSDDEFNLDNLSTNQCINYAISKMNISQEENLDSQVAFPEKAYRTCQVIVELIQKLPDIPWFPNGNQLISCFFLHFILLILYFIFIDSEFSFNYVSNGELNIDFLLDLRQRHDAYSSRKLERTKTLFRDSENNTSDRFDINIASSLVSHLTKNESILTSKSRENRWKSSKRDNNNTKGILINLLIFK